MTPLSEGAIPPEADPQGDQGKPKRPPLASRKWRWRLVCLGAAAILIVVFHATILQWFAGLLVVEGSETATEAIVFIGRSGPYVPIPGAYLAEAYRQGKARTILLIEDRSSRTVRAGVVPTLEVLVRRELVNRHVPAEALTVLIDENPVGWAGIRRLGTWMEEHPQADAAVLCGEFDSRQIDRMAHAILSPDVSKRLQWRPLSDSRHGVANWWHSRHGIMHVMSSFVSLA
jgi:hypothetical protein